MASEDTPPQPHQAAGLRSMIHEGARFVGSGLLAFPLGLGVAAVCRELLGWRPEAATATAFATLLLVNFMLGRKLVFRSSGAVKHELRRFMAVAICMRAFESLLSILLQKEAHVPYLASIVAALVLSSLIKFFLYRSWVFVRPPGVADHPNRS